jgi:hypothetical protein
MTKLKATFRIGKRSRFGKQLFTVFFGNASDSKGSGGVFFIKGTESVAKEHAPRLLLPTVTTDLAL